jgi:hypothetical protein
MADCKDVEMTKILGKIMQSSYKKKEVNETINRILKKIEGKLSINYDEMIVKQLRKEFEEIRKNIYEI